MNTSVAKKVLLFSTLNPSPFWAGSENLWFDFVQDERVNKQVNFQVVLADRPDSFWKSRVHLCYE